MKYQLLLINYPYLKKACNYKCATCSTNATNCDTCEDSTNRTATPGCACAGKTYDDGSSTTCLGI